MSRRLGAPLIDEAEIRLHMAQGSRRRWRSLPHGPGWYQGRNDAREYLCSRGRRARVRWPAETVADVLEFIDGAWSFLEEVWEPLD